MSAKNISFLDGPPKDYETGSSLPDTTVSSEACPSELQGGLGQPLLLLLGVLLHQGFIVDDLLIDLFIYFNSGIH